MKLRYYLRGLGIGILVTALILGIAPEEKKETLSDEEVRKRAVELGMVDPSDAPLETGPAATKDPAETPKPTETPKPAETSKPTETSEPTETSKPTGTPKATATPKSTETPKPTATPKPTGTPKPTATPKPTGTPKPTATPKPAETSGQEASESAETVSVTIPSGSGSYSVSKKLEEAGLIEDAKEYDAYLCDNGYSKRLRAGTFRIPTGASWEEIAKIIATKG